MILKKHVIQDVLSKKDSLQNTIYNGIPFL